VDIRDKITLFLILITLAVHFSVLNSHQVDNSGSCVQLSDYSHFLAEDDVGVKTGDEEGKSRFGVFAATPLQF